MKVLHFGRFYSPNFGGLERHVELLLERLQHHVEVDNIVSNDRFKSEIIQKQNYNIYKIASVGVAAGTSFCPAMLYSAYRLHALKRYDIFHLHFPDPMSHLVWHFLRPGAKLVISWHSDIVRQKRLLAFYRPFLNQIVSRADAIIAATPKHFSSSTQLGACRHPDRLHVVPYGIDDAFFKKTERISRGVETLKTAHPGRKLIFSIGRHVYYKGFDYLLRAMGDVRGAVLLLGGIGPLTDKLKTLASSLGLADKVFFLGRVEEEMLQVYYHACDIFCMPSVEKSEAFGLVQAEAMACGKPVVCCDLNNGVTYVNQHGVTGLVVPPKNSTLLAAALKELLDNDEMCHRMGEAAKIRVMREFTLERMVEDTLQVYQRVLSEKT